MITKVISLSVKLYWIIFKYVLSLLLIIGNYVSWTPLDEFHEVSLQSNIEMFQPMQCYFVDII